MSFLFERPISVNEGFLYYQNGAKNALSLSAFLAKVGVIPIANGGTGVSSINGLKSLLDVEKVNDSLHNSLIALLGFSDSTVDNFLASGTNIDTLVSYGYHRFSAITGATYNIEGNSVSAEDDGLLSILITPGSGTFENGFYKFITQVLVKKRGIFYRVLENRTSTTEEDGSITENYIWTPFISVGVGGLTFQDVLSVNNESSIGFKITDTTDATNRWSGSIQTLGGIGVQGSVFADKLYGAAYNDYAEYRMAHSYFEPGTVVVEDLSEPDFVTLPSEDNLSIPMVVSNTFGFCIGPKSSEDYAIPVAVSGRVLTKISSSIDRNSLKPGMMLKASTDGTADLLTKEEYFNYPDRLLGYVSSVPDYEIWEGIPVENRVWVRGVH